MLLKVVAIGERPLTRLTRISDLDINLVADGMDASDVHVLRCRRPADLLEKLARLGARGRVARLDVFDHGAEGMQMLGEDALFASDSFAGTALVGDELARQLAPYLTETAHVRLLGRATGDGAAGRQLLRKLARALGANRIVSGTVERAAPDGDGRGRAPGQARRPAGSGNLRAVSAALV
jgi:hypothetical protein